MSDSTQETKEPVAEQKSDAPKDTVAREDMDRALTDLKKWKAKAKELEDAVKAKEVASLKEKQDWQKIAEMKEIEAKEATEREEGLKKAIATDKKYNAVLAAASSLGLRKEAVDDLNMLDMSDVQIEYTNMGRVAVHGADKFAERLKTLKPHWFGQKSNKVNSNSPDVEMGEKITMKQIRDAERKYQETGDLAPYQNILKMYKKQQQLTK